MKFLTLFLLSVCSVTAAISAETEQPAKDLLNNFIQSEYGSIKESPLPTGILYDLVAPLSQLADHDGTSMQTPITAKQWIQMSHELRRATLSTSPIPSYNTLNNIGSVKAKERIHPMAVLDFQYNRFRPDADRERTIVFENQSIQSIDEEAVETKRVFAAAALHDWTYRGKQVNFQFDTEEFYLTNIETSLTSLEIDFDDGLGYRTAAKNMTVSYSTEGKKTIRVRATRPGDIPREGSFLFDVRSLDTPNPTATWQLEAAIPHDGNYSSGEVYIYLSDLHSSITNPIILAEGIDLDNSRNWDELYDMLNQEGLVEAVRAMGFDIVVLNHNNGTDYIQGNAYLLVELINQVNAVSADNSSIVLVGVSMGGQTTRYALSYMESNDMPHNVKLWISFDSPHRGANIPLGIQYWVDFFAGQSSDAGEMRDALNSPAAKQLLLAHFTSPPSSQVGSDALRADFLNDLSAAGNFPELPRNVALANGSGTMQGLSFTPGTQLIRWEYSSFLVDITGNCWSLNDVQTTMIFDGEINQIWPLPDESRSVTVHPTWPYDNAPGGKTNSMEELDAVDPGGYGDIVALQTHHCFIPTVSALNLAVVDPFYNIQATPNIYSLTPFDTLYYPSENQSHSKVVPENYNWLVGELLRTIPELMISVNPESLTFGQIHVDSVSEQSITLTNDGTWDATITGMQFAVGSAFSLTSAPTLPMTIPFAQSTNLTAQFDPADAFEYIDTLRIMHHGTVIAALPVSGQGIAPAIVLSTDSLHFRAVEVGDFADLSFTISNTGLWDLTVNSVTFDLGESFNFSSLPDFPMTIAPASSELFTIRFTPESAGMFNDTLTITHDSGDAISISLDGTGIEASMSVSTDSIEFGERWIESTSSENIWIHNTGNAPLLIDSIYCQGEGFEFTSGSMSIPALDSLMFAAPFTPADTLEYSGDLTIVTNIGNQVIAVAGHGIWTELAVEPEQIELFDLTPNEEVFRAIVLTSIGNTFIGDVSAELVVGGAFTVQDFPADSLPAYGTDSIVVRFLSTVDTAGIFFDTLIISSAVGDPIEIPLLADVFSGLSDNQLSIPNNFYLRQNYPNPFNPSTTLEFGLPVTSEVSLKVYDLQGRLVEEILNASLGAGHHSVVWNCSSCASGLYLFILNTPEQPFARKAMLLK